jgi:hypothetical protein
VFNPFRTGGILVLIRILPHRSEIVLGVLEVILRRDPVPGQGFGARQGQIALIVPLGILSVPSLGAGQPGRFVSPGGLGSSRHRVGHSSPIWLGRACAIVGLSSETHFMLVHVPLREAVRRSFEELSCAANTVDRYAATSAAIRFRSDQTSMSAGVRLGPRSRTQRPGRTDLDRLPICRRAKWRFQAAGQSSGIWMRNFSRPAPLP